MAEAHVPNSMDLFEASADEFLCPKLPQEIVAMIRWHYVCGIIANVTGDAYPVLMMYPERDDSERSYFERGEVKTYSDVKPYSMSIDLARSNVAKKNNILRMYFKWGYCSMEPREFDIHVKMCGDDETLTPMYKTAFGKKSVTMWSNNDDKFMMITPTFLPSPDTNMFDNRPLLHTQLDIIPFIHDMAIPKVVAKEWEGGPAVRAIFEKKCTDRGWKLRTRTGATAHFQVDMVRYEIRKRAIKHGNAVTIKRYVHVCVTDTTSVIKMYENQVSYSCSVAQICFCTRDAELCFETMVAFIEKDMMEVEN